MKAYVLALILSLFPCIAFAAIPAGAVWEVRTAGSSTNGGAFVAGISSIGTPTDLVVDASNNTKVSSAGYGFSSADVGRWIKVTGGTGWTTGSYNVLSVTTGVATLSASPAAVSTTGGQATVYYGLDYSQQNAANSAGSNISTTDLVTAGTTTIVSVTANFTRDAIGNVVYITGGTGSITAQRYEITAWTNSTTVTVDRSTGLSVGTGATLNIGGAIDGPATLASFMVSGNKAFIKNDGTYQLSAGVTFSQTQGSFGAIIGYTTTRGDTGHPTIQGITNTGLTLLSFTGFTNMPLYNITVDCNSLGTCIGISATSPTLMNNKVLNYTTAGISANFNGGQGFILKNEVTAGSGTPIGGIYVNQTSGTPLAMSIYGNYVHDGVGPGISASTSIRSPTISYNIVANQSGVTSDGIILGIQGIAINNTVYNSGRDGIRFGAVPAAAINNILVSNAGYGLNSNSTLPAASLYDGNAYYNNTLRARNGIDDMIASSTDPSGINPYINTRDIILTGDPFVNAAGGNFALNSSAGAGLSARNSGLPSSWPGLASTTSYLDFGAVQHQCPGTGATCVFGN